MTVAITHPDLGAASCATVAQFEAIYEGRGWQLVTDADGNPVAADAAPLSHVTPTPITPAEVAAAAAAVVTPDDAAPADDQPRRKRGKSNTDGAAVTDTPHTED